VVVVIGLMVKGTRILVVDPPKSWLRVPQKVMPRNPDKLAYANSALELVLTRFHKERVQKILFNVYESCSVGDLTP